MASTVVTPTSTTGSGTSAPDPEPAQIGDESRVEAGNEGAAAVRLQDDNAMSGADAGDPAISDLLRPNTAPAPELT
jgi:hypothetical protein